METEQIKPILDVKKHNFWWPQLDSVPAAQKAIKDAFGAGIFICVLSSIVALLPIFGFSLMGFGLTALGEVVIIGFLLVGLKRKSRICAIILALYYFYGKGSLILQSPPDKMASQMIWLVIFFLYFLNGARGAFAYYKLSGERPRGFRWQTIVWVLCGFVFFVSAYGVASWSENLLLSKKLEPVTALITEGKFDEANKLADEILKPFAGNDNAIAFQRYLKAETAVLQSFQQGTEKLTLGEYEEANELFKKTMKMIKENAAGFDLSEDQLKEVATKLIEKAKGVEVSDGIVALKSLNPVREEMYIWLKKSYSDGDQIATLRIYIDSLCGSLASMALAPEEAVAQSESK